MRQPYFISKNAQKGWYVWILIPETGKYKHKSIRKLYRILNNQRCEKELTREEAQEIATRAYEEGLLESDIDLSLMDGRQNEEVLLQTPLYIPVEPKRRGRPKKHVNDMIPTNDPVERYRLAMVSLRTEINRRIRDINRCDINAIANNNLDTEIFMVQEAHDAVVEYRDAGGIIGDGLHREKNAVTLDMGKEFYSFNEAARYLQCGQGTISRMIQRGELSVSKLDDNGRRYFNRQQLEMLRQKRNGSKQIAMAMPDIPKMPKLPI